MGEITRLEVSVDDIERVEVCEDGDDRCDVEARGRVREGAVLLQHGEELATKPKLLEHI